MCAVGAQAGIEDIQRLVSSVCEDLQKEQCWLADTQRGLGDLEWHVDGLEDSLRRTQALREDTVKQFLTDVRRQIGRLRKDCVHTWSDRLQGLTSATSNLERELDQAARLALLGQLAASLAHEIRNPLCGMLLSLEVLQTKLDGGDSRLALVESVRREAERMSKIVENLLHFAQDYKPHLVDCALKSLVRKSVESVQSHLKKKHIAIEMQRFTPDSQAVLDPDMVQQVFRNILLNAIDASPEGGALLIAVVELEEPGEVGIAFKDTGQGIREEMRDRIFEPFYTSKEKGVGLGLAVSKKIVEANNGRIVVESEPGKGATFTVIFPRSRSMVAA